MTCIVMADIVMAYAKEDILAIELARAHLVIRKVLGHHGTFGYQQCIRLFATC